MKIYLDNIMIYDSAFYKSKNIQQEIEKWIYKSELVEIIHNIINILLENTKEPTNYMIRTNYNYISTRKWKFSFPLYGIVKHYDLYPSNSKYLLNVSKDIPELMELISMFKMDIIPDYAIVDNKNEVVYTISDYGVFCILFGNLQYILDNKLFHIYSKYKMVFNYNGHNVCLYSSLQYKAARRKIAKLYDLYKNILLDIVFDDGIDHEISIDMLNKLRNPIIVNGVQC